MVQDLGQTDRRIMFYNFKILGKNLDIWLHALSCDDDVRFLSKFIDNDVGTSTLTQNVVKRLFLEMFPHEEPQGCDEISRFTEVPLQETRELEEIYDVFGSINLSFAKNVTQEDVVDDSLRVEDHQLNDMVVDDTKRLRTYSAEEDSKCESEDDVFLDEDDNIDEDDSMFEENDLDVIDNEEFDSDSDGPSNESASHSKGSTTRSRACVDGQDDADKDKGNGIIDGKKRVSLGGETDIVPLSYHIVDDLFIQFGREEFCLVTGLRFGVEYSADYNNDDDPIPFRRRVFSSAKDGIFQFVLLGLEDRRSVPDWILRLANDRDGWDKYPWDLDIGVVPALSKSSCLAFQEKKIRRMLHGFFHGRLPTERLTPDENEAASVWWVSSRAYFDGRISDAAQTPRHVNRQNLSEFPSKFYGEFEEQKRAGFPHAGPSSILTQANSSFFEGAHATPSYGHNMATPNWQTPMSSYPGTSNWQTQMPSRSATPNWQTPIPSHPHDAGLFNPNVLNRERREVRPNMYRRTLYMDLPPTTFLSKKHGDKTKNKGKNANVSPLNLRDTFADDNVG
ncbi:hypothetical protein Tco_1029963 [Tanacetum coccineum]|uniref:Uncharacterized protein n=1 Tax=Tanacetum coccineum TaxID=301880 RepID=A0ABQ5G6Q6_9ASTR